ncbi:hypothetical protein NIES22_46700 [Calothrix brevissima NIES-22]|nr:hypothetical protein NIES22_46700 [Calothrix brevissima NIES-22]
MKPVKPILTILVLLTLLSCIQVPTASADILSPGESRVNYCFQIANLNKYSNYFIVANIKSANPSIPTYNRILESGKCLGLNGYREYSDVYALKKSLVKSQEILKNKEGISLKNFNSKKSVLIPAKASINPVGLLPDRYGVKEVADVLEIVAIKPKSLELKYKEVIYTYQQGSPEKKAYQTQDNRPLPSLRRNFNFLNLIIPGFSLVGIVLVYKKSNFFKKRNKLS